MNAELYQKHDLNLNNPVPHQQRHMTAPCGCGILTTVHIYMHYSALLTDVTRLQLETGRHPLLPAVFRRCLLEDLGE